MALIEDRVVAWLRAIAGRTFLASVGWWIISEGQLAALGVGIAGIALAVGLSLYLAPPAPRHVRLWNLVLFIGYFLRRSLLAGLDVGRRILQPSLPIAPALVRVPLSLPPGPPRWLLIQTLSLVPGTLSVAIQDSELILHCLNRDADIDEQVRDLERRIGSVFSPCAGATR